MWHQRRFEPAEWIADADAGSDWPARRTMVDHIMGRKTLDSLPRDSVIALLGPGGETSTWPDWDLVYRLVPERGILRLDSEWLVARFRGKLVAEYRVVRD